MLRFSLITIVFASLVSASFAAEGDRDVVKVNGTPIRRSEVVDRLLEMYGAQTVDEMIDELLLRQEAVKKNVKAESSEVDRRISSLQEQLQLPDAKALEAQLAQSRSSLSQLKQKLSDEISIDKLISTEKKISVPEADVKDAFEKHKDELGRPESVHLRHILVSTQEEADAIVKKVKGGDDFKALAREKSLAPTGKINGGDYGFVRKGMLPPDIEEVAFALKAGELKTIQTGKGWHILQAVERRAAQPATYAKVKDEVRNALLKEKIKSVLPDYLKELRSKADIQPQG